ncbi:MAG: hypothetical protein LBC19_12000 [Tannerella sp.]|jgi:chromosomal replication initiation ATPase DnaA|nr:hypothetical protein [Tannerella sp.]
MIDNVLDVVSESTGICTDDIFSKSKKVPVVYARHLCMYALARTNHRITHDKIASMFGIKRPAVSKAISSIEFELKHYKPVQIKVNRIMDGLRG